MQVSVTLHPRRLHPRNYPSSLGIRSSVGPTFALNFPDKKKIFALSGFEPRIVQPVS